MQSDLLTDSDLRLAKGELRRNHIPSGAVIAAVREGMASAFTSGGGEAGARALRLCKWAWLAADLTDHTVHTNPEPAIAALFLQSYTRLAPHHLGTRDVLPFICLVSHKEWSHKNGDIDHIITRLPDLGAQLRPTGEFIEVRHLWGRVGSKLTRVEHFGRYSK